MARDSQAALVALNRFGFGARGGASGDFVNAASDPRGFVKAELSRPNGVLLEMPGLASTPALAKAVFQYQFEIQQAREAASKSTTGAATESPPQGAPDDKPPQRRNLSLSNIANDISPKEPAMQPAQNSAAAAAGRDDAAERAKAAAATAQHHPENLSRRGAGADAARDHGRLRFCRAAGGVLVQSFLHLRQQGRAGADVGRLVRARGDPPSCARAFRRHAEGGRAASGDAVLPRQPAIARAGLPRRHQPQPRAERKSRARNSGAAYARRERRLHPGRRHLAGAHHHGVDLCRAAGATRRARHFRVQCQCAPARRAPGDGQDL